MADGDAAPLPEVEFSFEGPGGAGWRPVYTFITEGVSKLYEASLILANRNLEANIDDVFEKSVSVTIDRAGQQRQVKGLVRHTEDLGTTGMYRFARIVIVPQLWQLSKRVNSRIWQEVNVLTVIEEVLREAGVYQGEGGMQADGLDSLPEREYCVQYRETDLNFVLRLLEDEGVPFYFKHDGGGAETWVLAGDGHNYEPVPTMDGGASIRLQDGGTPTAAAETLQWFDWHLDVKSTGIVLRDFDFTHPHSVLDMTPRAGEGGVRPVYDYPAGFTLGPYDDGNHVYRPHFGQRRARVRMEELVAQLKLGTGRANVSGFLPGTTFTAQGHHRTDLDRRYLLLHVEHRGVGWGDIPDDVRESDHVKAIVRTYFPDVTGEETRGDGAHMPTRYWNRFEVIPAETPFRPERVAMRPVVPGPQTGFVMAPKGQDEEIATDYYGRVLVRFHWERPDTRGQTQREKNASCWIRCAQAWAGAAWGTMFIPRVGMEVVVHFLEGDPDRPLVTGCVYNAENTVPYPLPAEKTKSVIKTSSSRGGQGFNELRFEDLKDSEEIWIHAQLDMNTVVRHDETLTVGHDRTKTIQGMEHNTIQKDRVSAILQNDSLEVEGNQVIVVHGGQGMSTQVDTNFTLHTDKTIGFTVGDSSIVMTTSKITISAPTIEILGGSLINQYAPLVKINCSDGTKATVAGVAATAANAMNLRGVAGSILNRLKDLIDPAKIAAQVTGAVDGMLKKLGVPDRIRERLGGLARDTVSEVVTSLKNGQMPNFSKIAENAITTVVGIGADEAFRHLENIPAVKNSKILSGLVKEVKAVTKTSASYGLLRAAGIRDGLAKDPFFTVLKAKHGEEVKTFLRDTALGGATEAFNAWVAKRGLPPVANKIIQAGEAQLKKLVDQGLTRLLLPSGT